VLLLLLVAVLLRPLLAHLPEALHRLLHFLRVPAAPTPPAPAAPTAGAPAAPSPASETAAAAPPGVLLGRRLLRLPDGCLHFLDLSLQPFQLGLQLLHLVPGRRVLGHGRAWGANRRPQRERKSHSPHDGIPPLKPRERSGKAPPPEPGHPLPS